LGRKKRVCGARSFDPRAVANAMGIGHLYTRRKDGKYSRVEDEAHLERFLTEGEERKDY